MAVGGAAKVGVFAPFPVKDQLPGVDFCVSSSPSWRNNYSFALFLSLNALHYGNSVVFSFFFFLRLLFVFMPVFALDYHILLTSPLMTPPPHLTKLRFKYLHLFKVQYLIVIMV
jgi:hypothetical protein